MPPTRTPTRTPTPTPARAWQDLVDGNRRFAQDRAERPNADAARRLQVSTGQAPFAVVLGCSDSRVPMELVFDCGLGDLFVVRTAGHVLDPAVVGSVEFAVVALGVPLLVVLGHESCGAVGAALTARREGKVPGGFVRDIIERVTPSVLAAEHRGATEVDDVVLEHVRSTVDHLVERSEAVGSAVTAGRLGLVGAVYRLANGRVEPIDHRGIGDVTPAPEMAPPGPPHA